MCSIGRVNAQIELSKSLSVKGMNIGNTPTGNVAPRGTVQLAVATAMLTAPISWFLSLKQRPSCVTEGRFDGTVLEGPVEINEGFCEGTDVGMVVGGPMGLRVGNIWGC